MEIKPDQRCPACGKELTEKANFCGNCGKRLHTRFSFAQLGIVALVALIAWGISWGMQVNLQGVRPTAPYDQASMNQQQEQAPDPELDGLRTAAEQEPNNKTAWTTLADKLFAKQQQDTEPNNNRTFEIIHVLSQIIRIDPQDKQAVLALADISFEQQVFNKAVEFYKRYLTLDPADDQVRARYASSLSLMGNNDDAIKELEGILVRDPKNFHAEAYLSIAYYQRGDKEKAKELGNRAIQNAPTEEARARFSEFLSGTLNKTAPSAESVSDKPATPPAELGVENAITTFLKTHPISGPKFKGATRGSEGELILHFAQFPMDKMPPFVKEKFLGQIKALMPAIRGENFKEIVFQDEGGHVMERLRQD